MKEGKIKAAVEYACPYNCGVVCGKIRDCMKCDYNPFVHKARVLKLRARRQKELKEKAGGVRLLMITVAVDAPAGQAIGIKEQLAMQLEQFGNTRVVSVKEITPEQMSMEGKQ